MILIIDNQTSMQMKKIIAILFLFSSCANAGKEKPNWTDSLPGRLIALEAERLSKTTHSEMHKIDSSMNYWDFDSCVYKKLKEDAKQLRKSIIRIEKASDKSLQDTVDYSKFSSTMFIVDTFFVQQYYKFRMDFQLRNVARNVEILDDAITDYRALVDKYYKILLSCTEPKFKDLIVRSQEKWEEYNQSELDLFKVYEHQEFGLKGGERIFVKQRQIERLQNRLLSIDKMLSPEY